MLKPTSSTGLGRLEFFEKAEERITPKPVIMLQTCSACERIESVKYAGTAFRLVTPERTWILIAESAELAAQWEEAIGRVAFGGAAAAAAAGPPKRPVAAPTEKEEENLTYSSGGIFACQCVIRRRPELDPLGIGGPHSIVINMDSLSIFDESSRFLRATLHFDFMRKYASNDGYVVAEMGRRSQTGEASVFFETPKYEALFVALDRVVRQRQAAMASGAVSALPQAPSINYAPPPATAPLVNVYSPVAPRDDRYHHLERPAAYSVLPDLAGGPPDTMRSPREPAQLPAARVHHNYDQADDTLRTVQSSDPAAARSYQNVEFAKNSAAATMVLSSTAAMHGYGDVLPAPDEVPPRIDPGFYMRPPVHEDPYADPPMHNDVYSDPHKLGRPEAGQAGRGRQMRMLPD